MTESSYDQGKLKRALHEIYDEEIERIEGEMASAPAHEFSSVFLKRMETLILEVDMRDHFRKMEPIQASAGEILDVPSSDRAISFGRRRYRLRDRTVRRLIVIAVILAVMVPVGVLGLYRATTAYTRTLHEKGQHYGLTFEIDEKGLSQEDFVPIIPTLPDGFEDVSQGGEQIPGSFSADLRKRDDRRVYISYSQVFLSEGMGTSLNAKVTKEWTMEVEGMEVLCMLEETAQGDCWEFFWVYDNQMFYIQGNADYEEVEAVMRDVCRMCTSG